MTRVLYNLNLLATLMVLLRQILFNLAITVIAEVILKRFSAQQVSSLHRVAQRYLTLITELLSLLAVALVLARCLVLSFILFSRSSLN